MKPDSAKEKMKMVAERYEKQNSKTSADDEDKEAERKFLRPINPDPIKAMAKELRKGKND